jgi:hypothetical protein
MAHIHLLYTSVLEGEQHHPTIAGKPWNDLVLSYFLFHKSAPVQQFTRHSLYLWNIIDKLRHMLRGILSIIACQSLSLARVPAHPLARLTFLEALQVTTPRTWSIGYLSDGGLHGDNMLLCKPCSRLIAGIRGVTHNDTISSTLRR